MFREPFTINLTLPRPFSHLRFTTALWGCSNKVPQTKWLETTEMYCLGSGDWKSELEVSAGPHSPETLGRTLLPPSSFGGGRQSSVFLGCSHITPTSASVTA